ncbi:hypothetical protein B0H16DRAFT_1710918 [Mycena metata]|uniref:Uncharacterized protein n=1 Tax=Mycena metata TaxID=1033252 RepID=A0AAD7K6W8_9AGAR|nr:hypothetical protein B0H16DRAFT_1710918 [Mycena metata]
MTGGARKGKAAITGRVQACPARVRVSTTQQWWSSPAEKKLMKVCTLLLSIPLLLIIPLSSLRGPSAGTAGTMPVVTNLKTSRTRSTGKNDGEQGRRGVPRHSGGGHSSGTKIKRADQRKRRQRIGRQAEAFQAQMDTITDVYVEWGSKMNGALDNDVPRPELKEVQKDYFIIVVNVFRTCTAAVPMHYTNKFTSSCLVSQDFFLCAPWNPSLTFSTRLMELFWVARLRTHPSFQHLP